MPLGLGTKLEGVTERYDAWPDILQEGGCKSGRCCLGQRFYFGVVFIGRLLLDNIATAYQLKAYSDYVSS
jgi:hypothetical protein